MDYLKCTKKVEPDKAFSDYWPNTMNLYKTVWNYRFNYRKILFAYAELCRITK